jgi:hypothetical protein
MTTLHTPEAHNNFNTTSFTDEKFKELVDLGFTVREIERCHAQIEYRKAYNQRPEVRAKRAAYNAARNARMAELKAMLRG